MRQQAQAAQDRARLLYRRTLALWAGSLLRASVPVDWPQRDPAADYRDRDWRRLYEGELVDD